MSNNDENDKLDWMYKDSSNHVDREEYLLGKSVDKTFEQISKEEKEKKLGLAPPKNHVEHECIPPSIRDFNKIVHEDQVDLSAKLQEDPLMAIKKQEEEARRQFLQNPIQLKKLQDALKVQEKKKKKKKKKKRKDSDSEDDLDKRITEKLKHLKGNSLSTNLLSKKKKSKNEHLDTILMHKFNQLKDKLSQKDMDDILAGKSSDSDDEVPKKNTKHKSSNSEDDSDKMEVKRYRDNREQQSKDRYKQKKYRRNSSSERGHEKSSKIYSHEKQKGRRKSASRDTSKERVKNRRDSSSESEYERSNRAYQYSKDKDRKISRNGIKEKKKYRKNSSSESEHEVRRKMYKSERQKDRRNHSSRDRSKEKEKHARKEVEYKTRRRNSSSSENSLEPSKQMLEDDNLDKIILEKLRMIRDSKPDNNEELENVQQAYSRYDSDNDEYVYKKKAFGLVKSDGTKIPLKNPPEGSKKVAPKKVEVSKLPDAKKNQHKKLTDKEKEELRKQMMVDAVHRDKERSDNLKKYRQENKKEENKIETFDKNFVHRELYKGQNDLKDVESRIKSKLNNIQRSSQHMNSNFSKRS